jgi:hypothetical protein
MEVRGIDSHLLHPYIKITEVLPDSIVDVDTNN